MTTKTTWWNEAPFLRLLPALMAGIAAGWYLHTPMLAWVSAALFCGLLSIGFAFLKLQVKFRFRWLGGAFLLGSIVALGGLRVQQHAINNSKLWAGASYNNGDAVMAALDETPVQKPASVKAVVRMTHLAKDNSLKPVTGKAIIYFQKSTPVQNLAYGTKIIFKKPLQPIANSGNPGAFDYQRYSLFQGITHQVFLKESDFKILPQKDASLFKKTILQSRLAIVAILRKYIAGPKEQGLAEALLIGYKDDLDKSLVQAYSNTGVVHVIAISGLHLGLIYGILVLLLRPLKKLRVLRFLLILSGLWAFTLLAGAQPSVLRSAVMFSCIALGELMGRKSAILNTLAFSAFGLLVYNPFWLWDLGFQLSYAAVASIVIFYKPFYHLLYFPNKLIDSIWKLVALTLTAQIFTLPISLYHFHQFPVLFLVTNLLAVPLSSVILIGEILLCAFSFWPVAASFIGYIIEVLIRLLNNYITRLDALPFAVWDGFSLSAMQVVLLFIGIGSAGFWLLAKNKKGLYAALISVLLITAIHSFSVYKAGRQKQLIVYNVPKHRAADIVAGRQLFFKGDTILLQENFLRNFHLKPSRIQLRIKKLQPVQGNAFRFSGKTIAWLDSTLALPQKPDVLIVSGRAMLPQTFFTESLLKPQVVLDATVPQWRAAQWNLLCATVGWPLHDVKEKGAFVIK